MVKAKVDKSRSVFTMSEFARVAIKMVSDLKTYGLYNPEEDSTLCVSSNKYGIIHK